MPGSPLSSASDANGRDYFVSVNQQKVTKGVSKLAKLARRNVCIDCDDPLPKNASSQRCIYCTRTFDQFLKIRKVLKVGQAQNVLDVAELTGVAVDVMFKLVRIGYLRRVEPTKMAELAAQGCEVCRRPTNGERMCRGCRDRFMAKASRTADVVAKAREAVAAPEPVAAAAAETPPARPPVEPVALVREKPVIRVKDRRAMAREAGRGAFARFRNR